ncbi:MAG: hypothetical protein HYX26_03040 [Acidobacteriales bacterium]|nr:hypothetical protein [Terriglobales bacterium]
MRFDRAVRSISFLIFLFSFQSFAQGAPSRTEILPLSQVRPGMQGVAYTVFQGTKPEPMALEVLGILRNALGPKNDLILIRLQGEKPDYTGVVAGMSGSPVYVDGKLLGALSYRIGVFTKEPIAGVTPIEQMLEINELDRTLPAITAADRNDTNAKDSMSGAGTAPPAFESYARTLTPIGAPLVFNGFSEETLRRFGPQIASAGLLPVMGIGTTSDAKQPEPIEPGSSVGTVNFRGGAKDRQFHYEMLNSPRLTPLVMMITVFNALQSLNEHGENVSYRLNGAITVKGFPKVTMQNMYASADAIPTPFLAALGIGEKFSRIYNNLYQEPQIDGVEMNFEQIQDRRVANLELARTSVVEARPGDLVTIEAVLRPYRGERVVRRIPVRIPMSAARGTLRILVSDGDTLDRVRKAPALNRKLDLAATIAALNKDRTNSRLYVSLLDQNPQALVEDKVLPTLPLSVMNVMDGLRGTQDMVVLNESAVQESSVALDFVVSGAQVITITIK